MQALGDAWDVGPIVRNLDEFYEHRRAFWTASLLRTPPPTSCLWRDDLTQYLEDFDRVCVWLSRSLGNQVFFCLVLELLQRSGFPNDRVDVVFVVRSPYGNPIVDFSDLSSFFSADEIEKHFIRRPITRKELDATHTAWSVLTSSSPASLDSWQHSDECRVFNTQACLSVLRGHFPSASTGLNVWEERLLSFVASEETRFTEATSARFEDWLTELDRPYDFVMFQMLNKLDQTCCANPLVESHGDRSAMHSASYTITPFGRSVLEGRANHLTWNAIDAWVGGVHNSSELGQVWVRDEGKLRRW